MDTPIVDVFILWLVIKFNEQQQNFIKIATSLSHLVFGNDFFLTSIKLIMTCIPSTHQYRLPRKCLPNINWEQQSIF